MTRPYPEQAFHQALLQPDQPPPDGLTSWNNADPAHRFAIYRNNVLVSLIDALADSCPVTLEMVGDPFFRAMAREYVLTNPPSSPILAEYGATFPDFITGFAPAASLPYLPDLARLELLRIEAFHAADADPVAVEQLSAALADTVRLPTLSLLLHPSLRLLQSPHPVASLWGAHRGALELSSVNPDCAEQVLILRNGLEVELLTLAPPTAEFITRLQLGATLGNALESAFMLAADFDAGVALHLLISHNAICALHQQGEPS